MDKYKVERKIINIGGDSRGVTIPVDILTYLDNPQEVFIMPDKSKHGKFIAIWKKEV